MSSHIILHLKYDDLIISQIKHTYKIIWVFGRIPCTALINVLSNTSFVTEYFILMVCRKTAGRILKTFRRFALSCLLHEAQSSVCSYNILLLSNYWYVVWYYSSHSCVHYNTTAMFENTTDGLCRTGMTDFIRARVYANYLHDLRALRVVQEARVGVSTGQRH